MRPVLRQMRPALVALILATVALGLVYPLATTAVAQVVFPGRADGSLIEVDGVVRGSRLLAQPFEGAEYLHPRPSAVDHSGAASGGSNLGPLSEELLATVEERVQDYRSVNGLTEDVAVPVDAVTASGSGLDPHISLANARLQTPRIAAARGVDESVIADVIDDSIDGRSFGVLGQPGVNVVVVNAALDELTEG